MACELRAIQDIGHPSDQAAKESHWMRSITNLLWRNEEGQDVAEYAVMLAVILVLVIGTVRLIGGNANNVFSQVGSQMQ